MQRLRMFCFIGCPPSFFNCGESCYFPSSHVEYWTDTRAFCQGKGGDLVKITNEEEDFCVVDLLTRVSGKRNIIHRQTIRYHCILDCTIMTFFDQNV